MLIIRCIYVLHLLVTSGTGFIAKHVCLGDSVKVFETVTFTSQDTVVSLYMNYQMHTLIAQWHMQNLTIKPHIQPEYKEKVYLDDYGNIWIRNVNHWDEDSYFIESDISSLYVQYEVRIIMKVAPNKNCKPKITHLDKLLIAHLEAEDCGKPLVSLQWLDHPGFSNTSGSVINLPPGKEAGIYYACVEGPALECVKISKPSDYCSSYAIGENDSPTLALDILDLKTAISVIVPSIIVIGSLVLLIVGLYLIPKIRRRICKAEALQDEVKHFIDEHEIYLGSIPALDELAVTIQETGRKDNQRQWMSSQDKAVTFDTCRSSSSDEHEIYLDSVPTLDELAIMIQETERKDNQRQWMSSQDKAVTFDTCRSSRSDEHEIYLDSVPALDELAITIQETGRKDNQRQWMSSQDKAITFDICRSSSSVTFSEPGHSGIQPFNKDEQDANPEGDMAQTDVKSLGVLVKEDSDSLSDEESREPLLKDYGDQTL